MLSHRTIIAVLAIVAAITVGRADAATERLVGTHFAGTTPLFEFDQNNGSSVAIGPAGPDGVGDLTADPATGRVWGMKIATNELVEYNPNTGIGLIGAALDSTDDMVSIAYDPVTNTMYGNTSAGFGAVADELYSINPVTGQTTYIGRIGFTNVFALGFDQNGVLFGVSDATDQLIIISTANGNGALVASLQYTDVYDLASRPSDNVMFVATGGPGTESIYTMNTGSGAMTLVGPYAPAGNVAGLGFVPEPASLTLIALGGLALLRRRR